MEYKKISKSTQDYVGPILYCLALDISPLSKLINTERKRERFETPRMSTKNENSFSFKPLSFRI